MGVDGGDNTGGGSVNVSIPIIASVSLFWSSGLAVLAGCVELVKGPSAIGGSGGGLIDAFFCREVLIAWRRSGGIAWQIVPNCSFGSLSWTKRFWSHGGSEWKSHTRNRKPDLIQW